MGTFWFFRSGGGIVLSVEIQKVPVVFLAGMQHDAPQTISK